ncbi:MAG: response regulator [Opitutaceae bacterium]
MTTTDGAILLVEDNEDDVFLTQRALVTAGVGNPVFVVRDGLEAIAYLGGQAAFADRTAYPLPVMVFLDWKLPLKSGHEVLKWIREQSALESLVVVVLTSSDEPSDLRRAYSLGASSYLVKPLTLGQLTSLAEALGWRGLKVKPAEKCAP